VARNASEGWLNRRGGIYLLHADQMEKQSGPLLEAAARVVLDGARGTLAEYLQYTTVLDVSRPVAALLSIAARRGGFAADRAPASSPGPAV